ncbi:SRPBCC family protein [Streptomyces chiangmaiensis]|uniref:SRPBCC family protein n=1 Tax=Streptomyces chiangmaiensis TaxID=766497 RepID=A0ABU7FNX8_9ACTN|nr:SRPBCC family protein [Streptomyces chiangmaiensis]MED7825825.1 SRPBCC family protein [Streptomyces chiangmaiensis]
MDFVTGAQVAIALTVQISRERMWELITAVDRIGEWSPEAMGGTWANGALGPSAGARFTARNHFASGFVSTVNCVVTEAERPRTFAWTVLDDSGLVGSTWRYELGEGGEAGSTQVFHSFTHGPGKTPAPESEPRPIRRLWAAVSSRCAGT